MIAAQGIERHCPHAVVVDFLRVDAVEELLAYVDRHRAEFVPATVYDSVSHAEAVKPGARNCHRLADIGPFKPLMEEAIGAILPSAVAALGILIPRAKAREFEFCAYGDGSFFKPHNDTLSKGPRRAVSCVYYFFREPAGFSGGELRLHAWPRLTMPQPDPPETLDISPRCNSLVLFPSALRHEVRPITCPSSDWRDFRFTINCWAYAPNASNRRLDRA